MLKDMKMQANYQPIMISTLLHSPENTATRNEIAEKLKDFNSASENKDFRNVPVYEVLTNRGIVKKDSDKFRLNVGELSNEEIYQLSVICDWKNAGIPLQGQMDSLIKAFDKNRTLFNPDII